jgi:hypothetical protein
MEPQANLQNSHTFELNEQELNEQELEMISGSGCTTVTNYRRNGSIRNTITTCS